MSKAREELPGKPMSVCLSVWERNPESPTTQTPGNFGGTTQVGTEWGWGAEGRLEREDGRPARSARRLQPCM